ncbi:hypothetical protein [Arthrobacter cavernae]|uniref:hypothetical protein n=1 Tax=Arthrobacter cavernae TaxID=2817681 RepID=UPI0027DDAC03|nr:hypothetical protein [Arthrobacter cavernae]
MLAVGVAVAVSACSPAAPGGSATSPSTASVTTAAPSPSASQPSGQPAATPSAPVAGATAAVGELVAGFPQQLIPLIPGVTVQSSSYDKNSSPASAALVGRVQGTASAVAAFYTKAFEDQGFKAIPGDAVGDVTTKDFLRGDIETVNVSITEIDGMATFTIGANVSGGSIK